VKILHIRFQNLNSLSGTWEIDFTTDPYTANSLFAITGPTGAGKSTLLDALCLALYGMTPRLGKITKSSNQIMSRHTGVCFAEVTFQTVKGSFRCHWSQHRSRQRPGNELQQPRHEITDALTDTVLESHIRKVARKVEKVTGMDFERFTRSTLLAQGGFAAFLETTADKRSPILEQITGTEIYSQLSIKVHELRLIEQKKLEELEHSLQLIELLSPEAEKTLQTIVTDKEQESSVIRKAITRHRTNIAWLDNISRLKRDLATYLKALDDLQQTRKSKSEELTRLQPGLAAKELEPAYITTNNLISRQEESFREKRTLAAQYRAKEEKQIKLKATTKISETALQHAEELRRHGLITIKQVRTIDHDLAGKRDELNKEIVTISSEKNRLRKEQEAISTLRLKIQEKRRELNSLETFFSEHQQYKQLIEDFNAIEIISTSLNKLAGQQLDIQKEKKNITQQLQSCKKNLKQSKTALKHHQKATESTGALKKQLQSSLDALMQGIDAAELQQKIFAAENQLKNCQSLSLLHHNIKTLNDRNATLYEERKQLKKKENNRNKKLDIYHKEQTAKEKEIRLLEKNVLLLTRIQSLEEDRKQLKENSPCPLCGATDHPYSHGEIPKASKEEKQLDDARAQLKIIQENIQKLTHQEVADREKLVSLTSQSKDVSSQIIQLQTEAEQLRSTLPLPSFKDFSPHLLETTEKELTTAISTRKKIWQQQKKLHEEIAKVIIREEELTEQARLLENTLLEAKHQLTAVDVEAKRLVNLENNLINDITAKQNILANKLRPYDATEPDPASLPAILSTLKQKIKLWKNKEEREKIITPELSDLTSELNKKKALCKRREEELAVRKISHDLLAKQCAETQQRRHDLFAAKNTDKEESRLEENVDNLRKTLSRQQQELGTVERRISGLATLQSRLQQEISERRKKIETQQQLFNKALGLSIFTDCPHFLKSLLSPEEIEVLQQLQQQYDDKEKELTALCEEKRTTLLTEEAKQLCQESLEETKRQLQEEEQLLEAKQEEAVRAKEQLKRNNIDKTKSTTQLLSIAKQKRIVSNWGKLHSLIGSADGRKFRNFAQGITFEMMIHHANNHLRKMSDRYILLRDKELPLDLNVIDTYQADEIRSTRNLSGGESFLVSLALALGLSKMASNNVRVDSLFLDEGFGTLDEDALESALDTLAGLHEENKLIGIISHVAALKDRVPLQIEISPGSGGNSTISGPGVSKGDA